MFKVIPFEPKTLSWWHSHSQHIDFEPPYQRKGRLWSRSDKAFLIDSILNEYDIPKIYVADFSFIKSSLNKKKLPYAIVDGKQRFEAVFDFKNGLITLDPDFQLKADSKLKLGELGYADLAKSYPDIASIFDNFSFTVMRVITDEVGAINELFVRLNRSKPLTGAEIRNAMVGPVSEVVRTLTSHEFFKEYIGFSVQRAQDMNAAAKLLLCEYNEKLSSTKKTNLDSFARFARRSPNERKKVELSALKVAGVLERMTGIFLPHDTILRSAGVLPVYYWLVRESSPETDAYLREFLIKFENDRKQNRELANMDPTARIDSQLAKYDRMNRSPDDPVNHVGRYEILRKRLAKFAPPQETS
jgi:hypothetical protein